MHGKNKYPDNVVFMDKELGLRIPPHVFAVWQHLPFRDDCFHCQIVDPPHVFSLTSMFNRDPKARPNGSKGMPGWYGAFNGKRDAVFQISRAQREFARVSSRMCFKWNEASMRLENVLSLFDRWDTQFIAPARSRGKKPRTFWVKMTRKKSFNK